MSGFQNPYQEDRTPSKGELDQSQTNLGIIVLGLLGWTFTDKEKVALARVVGAVKREAPKTEHSSLVKLIRMLESVVT